MLTGRFGDTSGRPYSEARIHLPRLQIAGDVSFLVDTGADKTILMPSDARKLGVQFDDLSGDSECAGLGGVVHCYVERAVMAFSEPKVMLYAYDIEIDIMQDDPDMETVPSLLGRDIIVKCKLTFDHLGVGLRAKVHSADMEFDLRPSASLP